jgi:hypothetical protein
MGILRQLEVIAKDLSYLAATHPEAVEAIAHAVSNIMSSSNPVETARRAALVTASAEASEQALKHILG